MIHPLDFSFNSTIYSNRSTYAICYEQQEIRQSIDNEWYRAAVAQAGFEDSPIIMKMYIEPLAAFYLNTLFIALNSNLMAFILLLKKINLTN